VNERLRHQREIRGWTLDEVAERLHRLPWDGPEPGVDGHMVGRWERRLKRPAPRYVTLLCLLYELGPDELGLAMDVNRAAQRPSGVPEPSPARRRRS
jgi:transcriptional regulator with XRE-family HTH domain